MKRIAFVFLFCLIGASASQAQFKMGLQGGLAFPKYDFGSVPDPDASTGFKIGLMARVKIIGFYLQAEPSYARLGGDISVSDGIGGTIKGDFAQNRLDIPVLFGQRLGLGNLGGFRWNLGPMASFVLSEDFNLNSSAGVDLGNEVDPNKAQLGAQVGIGADIWKLTFDARYEFGLSKIYKTAQDDIKYNQFVFKVGLFFN